MLSLFWLVWFLICISAEDFRLSIVHVNDWHCRFEETNDVSGPCKKGDTCIGGFSRMYEELWKHKNRENVLFLNAGDNYQGTLWFNLFEWNATQYFLNKLPFDVYTLGNHEFDKHISGAIPFIESINAPHVVSNIDASLHPDFEETYSKSTVLVRGGKKIGIIGVIAENTNILSRTDNLTFLDPLQSINKEAEKLSHCDIIIVLSHCGYNIDLKVAEKVSPKINLIVGGHSHTVLYNGPAPSVEQARGPYPTIVEVEDGRKVLVVHAGSYSRYIGNLTVVYNDRGQIVNWEGQPIYLGNDKPTNPKIDEELDVWKDTVDAYARRVLGRTDVFLDVTECHVEECNIGSFFADAMVDYYKPHATIGLLNSGDIRTSLKNGNITYNDLVTCIPFESTIDTVQLTGSEIKDCLEHSFSVIPRRRSHVFWQLLQVSGLEFTADLNEPEGSKIKNLHIRSQRCVVPEYEPYRPDELYTVVVNSFLANGGDGYTIIKEKGRNHQRGDVDVKVFEDYIAKKSPVGQTVDGRMDVIHKRRK